MLPKLDFGKQFDVGFVFKEITKARQITFTLHTDAGQRTHIESSAAPQTYR